jgi:DNA polymerase I-like protein with 3'-5' exonuclease and polymerase domains
MIQTWMDAYDERTKAIHGSLFIASTLRYKHSQPNSANIPACRVDKEGNLLLGDAGAWTFEARDLWWAGEDEDYILVGIDAKGVQLRVLANYINHPPFTEAILSEDPHTANMKTFGLSSRTLTKTITYATLMGAGDARISSEAKVSLKEAKEGKEAFFRAVPSLPALIKRLQRELSDTGRITLCDGTPVLVSSPHMVIPYLLQGDESRLMKQALIYLDEELRRNKMSAYCHKVADVHDEWQWRVHKDYVDTFISLSLPCFIRAGESFGYNLPIEGDAKKGRTWGLTH